MLSEYKILSVFSSMQNCPLWLPYELTTLSTVVYVAMWWMCGIKLKDRLPSKELRERLGIDDIALVLQQNRRRWYGHVL